MTQTHHPAGGDMRNKGTADTMGLCGSWKSCPAATVERTVVMPAVYSKEIKPVAWKAVYTHSPVNHNSSQEQAIQVWTNKWRNKMWYMHIIACYTAFNKEDDFDTWCSMDEPWGPCVNWNEPITRELILNNFISMRFLKYSNNLWTQEVECKLLGEREQEWERCGHSFRVCRMRSSAGRRRCCPFTKLKVVRPWNCVLRNS